IDPGVAIVRVTTQQDVHDDSIGQERLFASLGSALAGLALLLACIGLYGLQAYNVARRTREIGLRMALGAQPRDVARSILRETLILTALGIGVGLPATFALTRLIKVQLYGVPPNDSLTLIVTVASLLAVALTAAWLPARRAARVDPVVALRRE
ncbi:MAG TPA: FtsX-like permease family protein, partial [Candidatus Synoicihabitans sp.]|nr:FtsX-like permease family protein [Candidatus Synoicihabitans sp.]